MTMKRTQGGKLSDESWIDEAEYYSYDFDKDPFDCLHKPKKELLFSGYSRCSRYSYTSFTSYLKERPKGYTSSQAGWALVVACSNGNLDAATALVKGEAGLSADVNFVTRNSGFTPLHGAAWALNPDITALLLRHGAWADVRCHLRHELRHPTTHCLPIFRRIIGDLPLETAFRNSNYFYEVSSELSILERLIELLKKTSNPNPEWRDRELETIKLLAWNTQNIGQVVYNILLKGNVSRFATLLLVAREKVMAPIILKEEDGFTSTESMTVHQCITNFIELFDDELVKLSALQKDLIELKTKQLAINFKKRSLVAALVLLQVFERVGGAFDAYLEKEQQNVRSEVASLLKDVGCSLKYKGSNLVYTDSIYLQPMDSVIQMLERDHIQATNRVNAIAYIERDHIEATNPVNAIANIERDHIEATNPVNAIANIERDHIEETNPVKAIAYIERDHIEETNPVNAIANIERDHIEETNPVKAIAYIERDHIEETNPVKAIAYIERDHIEETNPVNAIANIERDHIEATNPVKAIAYIERDHIEETNPVKTIAYIERDHIEATNPVKAIAYIERDHIEATNPVKAKESKFNAVDPRQSIFSCPNCGLSKTKRNSIAGTQNNQRMSISTSISGGYEASPSKVVPLVHILQNSRGRQVLGFLQQHLRKLK